MMRRGALWERKGAAGSGGGAGGARAVEPRWPGPGGALRAGPGAADTERGSPAVRSRGSLGLGGVPLGLGGRME